MPLDERDNGKPVPAREPSGNDQPRDQPLPASSSPASPPAPFLARVAAGLGLGGPLSPADLALFAELLAGLVRANLPLPEALKLIGKEAENRKLREALETVAQDVAAGVALPDALRRHEGRFPRLFTLLLEQGCVANDLHAALVELVREYRSQARFREQLWSQLMGPVVTAVFFGILVISLILFNVPQVFEQLYGSGWGWRWWWYQRPLPLPTRLSLMLGGLVRNPYAITAFLAACACAVLVYRRLSASRRVRYWVQRTFLRLPVLGPYLRTMVLGRLCRLLSLLLNRRLPLHAALSLVRDSFTFVPAQEAVTRVAEQVEKGVPLPDALGACRFFPPTLASFVRGAEVHGELPQSLSRLAEMYEERGDVQGTQVRFLLYLSAQLAVGACVLFLALSLFMPIFRG